MRRRRPQGEAETVELNMTSAIDVVFLLLIFFMTLMAVLDWPGEEFNMSAYLPRHEKGAAPTPEEEERNEVQVDLRPGPGPGGLAILFNGNAVNGYSGLRNAMRLLKSSAADSRVLLAVDRRVKYRHVIRTLDICAEYGFQDVSFAIQKKKES